MWTPNFGFHALQEISFIEQLNSKKNQSIVDLLCQTPLQLKFGCIIKMKLKINPTCISSVAATTSFIILMTNNNINN